MTQNICSLSVCYNIVRFCFLNCCEQKHWFGEFWVLNNVFMGFGGIQINWKIVVYGEWTNIYFK